MSITFREFVELVEDKKNKNEPPNAKNAEVEEGFSYGSKSYQQALEKKRTEAQNQKNQERQKRSSALYNERTRGRGIRARSKGKEGWIKDGKFTPDGDS